MEIYDFDVQEYNLKLAEALKKVPEFKQPEWSEFVKSAPSKERPIDDPDFWHKRAASILKQIYVREIVGVERLRTRYGNKKNRGQKPSKFVKGGGKIIRTILKQAEEKGLVEKSTENKKGRKLTPKGRDFLEKVASAKIKEKGEKENDKTLSKKD